MGSFVTFANPWMRIISCVVFGRRSILVSRMKRIHELPSELGKVN
jgi:hypothetical protein